MSFAFVEDLLQTNDLNHPEISPKRRPSFERLQVREAIVQNPDMPPVALPEMSVRKGPICEIPTPLFRVVYGRTRVRSKHADGIRTRV